LSLSRIFVDTEVFAALWRQRQAGEESENDILRRIYGLDGRAGEIDQAPELATARPPAAAVMAVSTPRPGGGEAPRPVRRIIHQEGRTAFPEGFTIFRGLNGEEHRAEVVQGGWRLAKDGLIYASLTALNQAIGAGSENVWMGWSYRDGANKRRPLDEYRLQSK